MERHTSKRSLRVAMVLGAAVVGTALVGWGGLAAWNAYTENAGNSVAAGTLSHSNQSLSCVSTLGAVPTSGPGFCAPVITVSGVDPVNFSTLVTPVTIKIDNTGNLPGLRYFPGHHASLRRTWPLARGHDQTPRSRHDGGRPP